MKVCVPITADGQVDPRWGRADRVALAEVADGEIRDWQEFMVGWGTLARPGDRGCPSRPGGAVPPGQPGSGDRCPPRSSGHAAHAGLDGDRGRHRSGRGRPQRGARGGVTKDMVSPQRNADPGCQCWGHPRMPLRRDLGGIAHGRARLRSHAGQGRLPGEHVESRRPRQRPQAGEQLTGRRIRTNVYRITDARRFPGAGIEPACRAHARILLSPRCLARRPLGKRH